MPDPSVQLEMRYWTAPTAMPGWLSIARWNGMAWQCVSRCSLSLTAQPSRNALPSPSPTTWSSLLSLCKESCRSSRALILSIWFVYYRRARDGRLSRGPELRGQCHPPPSGRSLTRSHVISTAGHFLLRLRHLPSPHIYFFSMRVRLNSSCWTDRDNNKLYPRHGPRRIS